MSTIFSLLFSFTWEGGNLAYAITVVIPSEEIPVTSVIPLLSPADIDFITNFITDTNAIVSRFEWLQYRCDKSILEYLECRGRV